MSTPRHRTRDRLALRQPLALRKIAISDRSRGQRFTTSVPRRRHRHRPPEVTSDVH
jgi:hypothetical protein